MRFEWDETKNRLNQRKHGFSFEEVTGVFLDPLTVIVPNGYDPASIDGVLSAGAIAAYCLSSCTRTSRMTATAR